MKKGMKLGIAAAAVLAGGALAQARDLTVTSWGGAYQNSQLKAYVEPYQALTGITVTWDESSNEAIAKLRAAQEAGLAAIPAIVRETGDDTMLRTGIDSSMRRSTPPASEPGARGRTGRR